MGVGVKYISYEITLAHAPFFLIKKLRGKFETYLHEMNKKFQQVQYNIKLTEVKMNQSNNFLK